MWKRLFPATAFVCLIAAKLPEIARGDEVVLTNGIRLRGKVVAMQATGKRAKGINRFKGRARAAIQTIKVFEALDLSKIADGAYRGNADAFRGNLEVEVKVQSGRIESVKVTQHKDDWFYTSLTTMPARIVEVQGLKGVDAVTEATYTSMAIINATANALGRAMR